MLKLMYITNNPDVAACAENAGVDRIFIDMEYIGKQIFTVQFHPEACPGPQDSAYLFDRFIDMMGGEQ